MKGTPRGLGLAALAALTACSSASGPGPWRPGQPLTLDLGGAFPAGAVLRDHYGGGTATVEASGSVTVTPGAAGVVLLERDGAAPTPFRWDAATVYFAMTDRFYDGDPSNDRSYGRTGDGADEVGTWHGGDLRGIVQKLDYVAALGADVLWISPPVEQVHGWVAGGSGDFKHYGYAGYWALDFTRIDANFGTAADLQELVDQAHLRGIRVLVDVVMNHPGYATGDDLLAYLPEVFRDGTGDAFRAFQPFDARGWLAWNDLVDYNSTAWAFWWGPNWIRAGFPGHQVCGSGIPCTDLTRQLAFLPDFITEGTGAAGVPTLFSRKAPDTGVTDQPGFTVRQYLVKWHTDWVRQYGVDGFRCDTAKHVELESWKALKDAAIAALADWKARNPAKSLDDSPFWMVGEVFPHGVVKDAYFTQGGFDSLLNFELQPSLASLLSTRPSLAEAADELEAVYSSYAAQLTPDPTFDALSYVSSHDTDLFYDAMLYDASKQRQAGTALLLAPGGAQIFYGDESGRRLGPTASERLQGTRSDMNWATLDGAILEHWRKLATFRRKHAAVGAGSHRRLASPAGTYAFARTLDQGGVHDAVVVAVTPPR